MHHNFGLSPFPLTARRPSSTNKRPVATTSTSTSRAATAEPVVAGDVSSIDESTGGDQ